MDYDKLIERLKNAAGGSEGIKMCHDAATAIETLHADLARVMAERDAAVSDLETIMAYGGGNLDTCQFCKNSQCYARGGTKLCLPERALPFLGCGMRRTLYTTTRKTTIK